MVTDACLPEADRLHSSRFCSYTTVVSSRRTQVETLDELLDSTEREDSSKRPARVPAVAELRELPAPDTGASRPHAVAGEVLAGKYRLLRPLGEGGMGSVWVAAYEALDIDVAVKIIRADVKGASAKKLSQRMQQEARAAARTGHAAIVRITDVGETPAGDAFCVMELLEGEDIAAFLVGRGRLNPIKAVQVLLPIAHALSLVHDQGIVHRDLKPDNIFLSRTVDGTIQPKLIDFGIAKMVLPTGSDRITQDGTLLGSPAYMSPEQGRGKDVDLRGDIWAFCVVLYEMVSNRMPFEGDNYNALVRAIIEDAPIPLTTLDIGDAAFWAILERGLAKDPTERWQSMRDLGAALARWLHARGVREDLCNSSLEKTWLRQGAASAGGLPAPADAFSRLSLPDISPTMAPPPSSAPPHSAPPPSAPPPSATPVSLGTRGVTPMTDVSDAAPQPASNKRSVLASVAAIGVVACVVASAYFLAGRASTAKMAPATPSPEVAAANAPSTSSSSAPISDGGVSGELASGSVSATAAPSAAKPLLFGRLPQPAKSSARPKPSTPPTQATVSPDLGLRRPTF